jgi:tRNA(Ile2) C34 agmatinyltransferase TiaS
MRLVEERCNAVNRTCDLCGEEIIGRGDRAIYCKQCLRNMDSKKIGIKPIKGESKKEKPEYDMTACKGCRYLSQIASGLRVCDYIGVTGKARSKICNPGADCTEYDAAASRRVLSHQYGIQAKEVSA